MDHDHYCSAIEAKELGLVDHLTLTLPHPSSASSTTSSRARATSPPSLGPSRHRRPGRHRQRQERDGAWRCPQGAPCGPAGWDGLSLALARKTWPRRLLVYFKFVKFSKKAHLVGD
eukprot:scaffold4925_cov57-Phaeocystis_antarctica.AAC.3